MMNYKPLKPLTFLFFLTLIFSPAATFADSNMDVTNENISRYGDAVKDCYPKFQINKSMSDYVYCRGVPFVDLIKSVKGLPSPFYNMLLDNLEAEITFAKLYDDKQISAATYMMFESELNRLRDKMVADFPTILVTDFTQPPKEDTIKRLAYLSGTMLQNNIIKKQNLDLPKPKN